MTDFKFENVKDLNIYEKLGMLQESITVNKSSINDYYDYKYRSIDDILFAIKPVCKQLRIVIRFTRGLVNAETDVFTQGLELINLDDLSFKIEESDEILIDRNKAQMDLSQKTLSAKTFLKKSMLENLLLINEEEDPEKRDNGVNKKPRHKKKEETTETKPKQDTRPRPNTNPTEMKQRAKLQNILYFASKGVTEEMSRLLEVNTSFKGRDGKQISGLTDFEKLKGKRLEVTLDKISKLYPEATAKVEGTKSKNASTTQDVK